TEVMLQWAVGFDFEHRAYWGANSLTAWGVDGTVSRRFMGPLPPTGGWVRLEVPAALGGLEGQTLTRMAFTLFNGRAPWDRAGKARPTAAIFTISGTVTLNSAPLGGVSFNAGAGTTCSASNPSGQYSCTVPAGFTGTVTPSLAGYNFTPGSLNYSNVSSN